MTKSAVVLGLVQVLGSQLLLGEISVKSENNGEAFLCEILTMCVIERNSVMTSMNTDLTFNTMN